MTKSFCFVAIASCLLAFASGCAGTEEARPEKRAPRVSVSGSKDVTPQSKALCKHAWDLYWASEAGSDEEARAEDMVNMFC